MPYKLQRDRAEAQKRYRERRRDNAVGITQGVRPIVYALSDPAKREKLRRICQSLEKHNVLDSEIYYGLRYPTLMSEVAELLTAFD